MPRQFGDPWKAEKDGKMLFDQVDDDTRARLMRK